MHTFPVLIPGACRQSWINRHSLSRNHPWCLRKEAAHGPSYWGESVLRPASQRYRRLGTISTGARLTACATLGMARVASANASRCPWKQFSELAGEASCNPEEGAALTALEPTFSTKDAAEPILVIVLGMRDRAGHGG